MIARFASLLPGPLLLGLALSACATIAPETADPEPGLAPVRVQILAINDFHGNLEAPQATTAIAEGDVVRQARLGGAAQLAATLANLRQANTITVGAGDLIGASPLISALFLDEPTIRALSTAGLQIAAVGNHEFDRGIGELLRMQNGGCAQFTLRQPCALEPFAGADFAYLAGNVVDAAGQSVLPATMLRELGGARVGFIGLTLEGTANLVAASATQGYRFLGEAETANRLARELREQGADAVVLLIHEGGDVRPRYNVTGCPQLSGAIVPIVAALEPGIALVVSGHTHQAYVCEASNAAGEPVLLTSAGRYGTFVTDIALDIDPAAGRMIAVSGVNVPVEQAAGSHPDVAAIVARYAEASGPIAARQVGPIATSGATGEDCLDTPAQGLVADAYLDAARRSGNAGADLALVNSGGVRTDLTGAADGVLTFGELSALSPFGNGVVLLEMSGADLAALLEAQWCSEGEEARVCQSLLIGSANLAYRVDRRAGAGERVSAIMLDGAPLDPVRRYRVVTNSFLAGGGDGFAALAASPPLAMLGFDIDALEAYVASGNLSVPICGRVKSAAN